LTRNLSKKSSYAQASKSNINEIIRISEVFLKLLANKVLEIHKILNNIGQNKKPKLNITMKDSSRKQVIVFMSTNNILKVIVNANTYVSNINQLLKGVKSEVSVDFIFFDNRGLLLTTNKVAISSDLNIIEKYLKDSNDIEHEEDISPKLLQSKSYLKILSISYFVKSMNLLIFSNIVESIIKSTHIFNDITFTSYPTLSRCLQI